MASYAASIGLKGFESWFIAQAKEEEQHARKFYDYLIGRGTRVILEDIEKPPQDFSSAVDLFEKTLAHEKKVTQLIHDLVDMAQEENGKETEKFLQWFVKEQVEEEATPSRILQNIKGAVKKDKKMGLFTINSELAKRR